MQTKSPFRMGVNAEALVTATPVLVLKDSREKIAKLFHIRTLKNEISNSKSTSTCLSGINLCA